MASSRSGCQVARQRDRQQAGGQTGRRTDRQGDRETEQNGPGDEQTQTGGILFPPPWCALLLPLAAAAHAGGQTETERQDRDRQTRRRPRGRHTARLPVCLFACLSVCLLKVDATSHVGRSATAFGVCAWRWLHRSRRTDRRKDKLTEEGEGQTDTDRGR